MADHELAIKEIKAASKACWDAETHYKEVTAKHFPVGCVVRWRQWLNGDEIYFCTGQIEAVNNGGRLVVRNMKTGKLRRGICVESAKVRRVDGES